MKQTAGVAGQGVLSTPETFTLRLGMIVCKPGTTSKYPKGLTEVSTRHLRKPTTAFPACGPQYQQPASPLCKIQSPKASLYSAASSSLQQHSRFNPASDAAHPGHTQACRAAFQSSAVSSPRHQRLMMQSHASGQTMVLSDSDPLQDESQMPLLGKRIMITAPRQYAHKLAGHLITAGARPVWVPSISISHLLPGNQSPMNEELQSLTRYDHIAFTSGNGIQAVMQRLEGLNGSWQAALQALQDSKVQCWALGADAEVLKQFGVQTVQTPTEASTQGLVKELQQQGKAQGARVLCPVPLVTGGLVEPPVVPRFLKALQEAGAEAVRLEVYQTAPGSSPQACSVEKQLLVNGNIHAIAFSSTAEAQGLMLLMGGAEVIQKAVRNHGVILAAHGPYTAAGAGDMLGCKVGCVSQNFSSFAGLIAALEHAFS